MTIRDRVRNGIKFLNKTRPGWRQELNAQQLEMNSCTQCVLGQIYGNYHEAIQRLNIRRPTLLGFQALQNTGYTRDFYDRLATAWRNELRTR